jgi:hypothetical protein
MSITINYGLAANGDVSTNAAKLILAMKVWSGEILAAYARIAVTEGLFRQRTIQYGKSASFPAFGRHKAKYLQPGNNLDDQRSQIMNNERVIYIDGMLTSDVLINDLEEAIAHYDYRSEYINQIGEALAISHDASVLAECAKEALNTTPNTSDLPVGGVKTVTLATGETVDINKETGAAIRNLLLKIKAAMSTNHVPAANRYAFCDPTMHAALSSNLDFLNQQYGASATLQNSGIISMDGFQIIECPHLTQGGDDNTSVIQGDGHIFPTDYAAKHPIVVCHMGTIGILRLKDFQLERARRANYQSDEIIGKIIEGMGGLRPEGAFIGVVNTAS